METSKNVFFEIRSKEYQNEQKKISESEVNNHIKINQCKKKSSQKK